MVEDFLVAEGLRCLPADGVLQSAEGLGFVNQSRRHHAMNSTVNPTIQLGSTEVHAPNTTGKRVRRLAFPLALPRADRFTGQLPNFQRTHDAADVVYVQPAGRNWVHARQP